MVLVACSFFLTACSHCDRAEEVLAEYDSDDRIVATFEACSRMGTTLESTILFQGSDGKREVLMEYAPNGGVMRTTNGVDVPPGTTPKATWRPDGSIEVHLDVVATVRYQKESVRGKRIVYRIDHDISRIEATVMPAPSDPQPSTSIIVAEDGYCVIGGARIPCSDVLSHLHDVVKLPAGTRIHVVVERNSTYESTAKVFELLQKSEYAVPMGYVNVAEFPDD